MLLINPPVVKPSEPPPGLAKLAGALRDHSLPCVLLDANLEGDLALLAHSPRGRPPPRDAWTRRAFRNLSESIVIIRDRRALKNPDRFRRAVMDVNRALAQSVPSEAVKISLVDYEDAALSPLRSSDLIRAAETPEHNPFFVYFAERLPSLLDEEDAPLVGVSLNYQSQALCAFAMMGFLKRLRPHMRIILGGGLVTSWMNRPGWRNPFAGLVDEMVAGPGEERLLCLMGVMYQQEHHTPEYGGLPLADYLSPGRVLPYSASQGCYWRRCSFCPETAEGNPYRPLAAHQVTADLGKLVPRMKPDMLHFLDNALSPALLAALVANPPGVPWYGFARVTDHLTDPDFLSALRHAGCVMVKIGLESGDQGVLDNLGKGIDLAEASRALIALRKAGIASYVYLLFGTPAETAAEAEKTLEFTARHAREITFLNLALFNLPAAGPEACGLTTSPFYEGDLSLYRHFAHPRGWDRHLVRRFLDRQFRRHPAIAPILRRDPPLFTSNHAPFFIGARESG